MKEKVVSAAQYISNTSDLIASASPLSNNTNYCIHLKVCARACGRITCSNPNVKLYASSNYACVSYFWTGPNGFMSRQKNPVVSTAGKYTVKVTTKYGQWAVACVIVTQNIKAPGAKACVKGSLGCSNTSVTLLGSSPTPCVTYKWTGPNNFVSTQKNPVVTEPGIYTLVVTNPANGCTSTSTVTVLQTGSGLDVTASVSDTLTCNVNSVTLMGSSNTSGVIYRWSGPLNFTSTEQNPVTTHAGIYTLTVTNPANECSSIIDVTVMQDTSSAEGVYATVSDTLTCTVGFVTITGNSATSGVTYSWTGPNGISSSNKNIVVSTPGNYILEVGKPGNGCVVSSNVEVLQDTIKPKDVVVNASGILSCIASSVALTGSSSTIGGSYNWSGPGFASTGAVVNVTNPGTYTLTVTNTANGCTTIRSLFVDKDSTPPENVTADVSGAIDCVNAFATLTGSSTTPGAQYLWTSPDNTEIPNDITYALTPGVYTLKVTNPGNGCSVTENVTVTIDTVPPVSKILASTVSPVALTDNILTAQAVSDATYSWEFSSTNQNWSIISGATDQVMSYQSGDVATNATFILKVTSNQNGCYSTDQVELTAIAQKVIADTEKDEKGLEIRTYPNPFTDKAIIEFIPEQSGRVTVELFTNYGILAGVLFNAQVQESQSYKITVDGTNIAAGTYHLIIRINDKKMVYSNKLILIK